MVMELERLGYDMEIKTIVGLTNYNYTDWQSESYAVISMPAVRSGKKEITDENPDIMY